MTDKNIMECENEAQSETFAVEHKDGPHCELSVVLSHPVRVFHPAYQRMEVNWECIREDVWAYHLRFNGSNSMREGNGIEITFRVPIRDMIGRWHPVCGCDRTLKADWDKELSTMSAVSAPVVSFFNGKDENRFTLALSETQKMVAMNAGVHEEDGKLLFSVKIGAKELEKESYAVTLYMNQETASLWRTLDEVRRWWERTNEIIPMKAPDAARYPMYSTWYSFHQDIDESRLEEEAVRAKALGFSTIIVDDGWQTDDNNRGYAYCGDWEPTLRKFPSMCEHVERIHRLGMKYMIWFSVPFLGIHSKHWEEFSDKLVCFDEFRQAGVLDIRFPEIREYLLGFYKEAVTGWKVDGLKLDFIDEFYFRRDTQIEREGISCKSIQEALDLFLREVTTELKKFNPDIMIEFRQRYIGPGIRRYGNIFRVGDCPESGLANRIGSVDLRMLSADTAVHSDMMMWNPQEELEDTAIQLQNSIFATPQVSVRLEGLLDGQKKLLAFWMKFCRDHIDSLQKAQIIPQEIGHLYPVVRTATKEEEIIAVYGPGRVIELNGAVKKHLIIWANKAERAFLQLDGEHEVRLLRRNCLGEALEKEERRASGCQSVPMTAGGLLEIWKE